MMGDGDRPERFVSSFLVAFFVTVGVLLVASMVASALVANWVAPGWLEIAVFLSLPFWCLGWGYLGMQRAERRTRLFGKHTGSRLAKMLGTPPSTRTHPRF